MRKWKEKREDGQSEGGRGQERRGGSRERERERGREKVVEVEGYIWREIV